MSSLIDHLGSAGSFSRRKLLQAAGLGGLAWLSPLTHILGRTQGIQPKNAKAKSVIILWMAGGPSQLETFDPHPSQKIAGGTDAINTAVKGVRIASGLPQVAEVVDELTIVRSMISQEGDHERAAYNMKTGYRPVPALVHPSIGAVLCHELPALGVDIPRHISILPDQWPARGGYLGAHFDAFKVYDSLGHAENMSARVKPRRQEKRLEALKVIEDSFLLGRRLDLDNKTTLHNITVKRALAMMNSNKLDAFDVSKASAHTREKFGDTNFGRGCLAAIQLIEAGVGCVEVTLRGWDTHINNHEGHSRLNAILDPAFAALIGELRARDMLDRTVVICAGEFGRTPKINALDGRDHWPKGFSVALAGGGFKSGYVHGKTDPEGKNDGPKDPVRVSDIHSTVLHQLGIAYDKEVMTPIGRPMRLSEGNVIKSLLKPT
jgi:hypothetical protein